MTVQTTTLQHPAAAPRARNLIAIASGKGGIGKTWLSITLSQALAAAGRRTLLFDGDLGLANVDIQLGLMPESDLGSVVEGKARMQDVICRYKEGRFDILAGKSGSGSLAALPAETVCGIRDHVLALAQDYDRVVLDLGAGIDTGVRTLAAASGLILVVATDEPTSLTDAYAFIKVMTAQNRGAAIRIVVNMSESAKEGERTYERLKKACESFLKISPPLTGIIRRDDKVKDSIRHQTGLLTRHPGCNAAADVTAIARKLARGP